MNAMRLSTRFIVITLILLVAFFPFYPNIQTVSAKHKASSTENYSLIENDPAIKDAEIYAKNMGVSVEEALYRFHIQDIAGELDAELSAKEPDNFAGLWLEHTPEFKVVILSTKYPERDFRSYLTEELAPIVEVRHAKISLANLQNSQETALASLWAADIPVESEINVYENNVYIFVSQKDKGRFDGVLHKILLSDIDYIKTITVPKIDNNLEDNIYGGLGLNPCTSGFSVQDSQGLRGIATAGHCSESYSLSYNGIDLPLQSFIKSTSYDVGWHTTTGLTVTNEIQDSSAGTLRRITATKSRDNQVIGGYVCKYAVVTGYTCGYIRSKSYASPGVVYPSPTFIIVDNTAGYNDLSNNGDSGGPWFNLNTAYGIHHGHPTSDINDAVYMAVNYVDGLGVTVVLNPVFADVPWDYWAWSDIERIYNAKVTGGCATNPLYYCPTGTLTRAQMAVFILRGEHGSTYTPPAATGTVFNDIPANSFAAAWIEQLAAESITGGCGNGNYCPNSTITHAEMAVFLLRAEHGSSYQAPPASGTMFGDVPSGYWAANWIEELAYEGIFNGAHGCSSGNYCPTWSVTRAEMAGMLVRTFNLP